MSVGGEKRAHLRVVSVQAQGMSMDEAYETVREVRPVVLDRREWVRG